MQATTRRILIVDGSPATRAAVRRLLALDRSRGYEVREVATAAAGLDALRAAGFDCVLLGQDLPDRGGLELLGELGGIFAAEAIPPVVLLIDRDDERLVDAALTRGAQDCLVKGRFTGEVLRRSINESIVRVSLRRDLDRAHRAAREAIRQKDEALARQAATEARLRVQLELVGTLARTTTEGLCMTDRRGRITFANPAAEAILGVTAATLVGVALDEVLAGVGPDLASFGGPIAAAGRPAVIRDREAAWAVPGGEPIPLACSAEPILVDGRAEGLVLAIRDITGQKRADAEMQRRAAELIESGRRKDEFLATLAHELRNPLAPILNAMRIIGLRSGGDPAQERVRAMVEQQVRHMDRLIDDLLDMSRISRGTIQLRRAPTELGAAVGRAVESIRHQVEARDQALEVDLPPGPVFLDADPTRLDQILSNLLTNAAKYTDPNGRIRLAATVEGDHAEVRVVDSGVGIAPDFLPRIFELFAQADRSLDRSRGGLGIGLTLVRDLVERHGGSISARSEGLGLGSEFVVRLPLAEAPREEPPATGHHAPPAGDRSVRVMVVDDNVHAAQSLEVVLQLWGHDVLVVHDGPSALDAAPVYRPEVILLDIGLPGMDGYRVAEQIRAVAVLSRTTILAMTGYGGAAARRRSAAAGFARHLVKPLDLDALERYLAEFDGPPTAENGHDDGAGRVAPAARPLGASET